MNFQAMHKQRRFILILAAIGAISVFLPWFTISAEGLGVRVSESQNGFHGTGVLVFLAFIAAGIMAFVGDQSRIMDKTMWMAALCTGAVALIFVVINLINTPSGGGFGFGQAGPGYGIWISLLAAVGTLGATWAFRNPGDTLKSGFDSLKHDLSGLSGPAGPAGPASNASNHNSAENSNKVADLEKLIDMRNQGKISEEEYQRMKAKLL